MRRRIILLSLVGCIFVGVVFLLRQIGSPVLPISSQKDQPAIEQFELLTDDATETLPISKEILLSSPLVIFGKGTATPFTPSQVIAETNRQRQDYGVASLSYNPTLAAMAQAKVRDMFENQYFDHYSPITKKGPDGLAKDASYAYVSIGENLALGNFGDEASLVDAWMQSPGHRANILRTQFQEIGVAVGRGEYQGQQVLIAVQEFGRPLSSCPYVDPALKDSIDSSRLQLSGIASGLATLKTDIYSMATTTDADEQLYEGQVQKYNTQVAAYNDLASSTKQQTNEYNTEVQAFNACLQNST